MLQFLPGINLFIWIPVVLAFIGVTAAVICRLVKRRRARKREYSEEDDEKLYQMIEDAGYAYDPHQDIFYSTMYPWQRKMGYCRLYDEASAPLSMIMDCEPIYFNYGGKRWLIEFWKGQYGMTTGGEIGVYNTEGPDLDIPGLFNGTFYNCASDEDRLYMSYSLIKNGKLLFQRKDKHWWLTGFKLGEFAEPSQLKMYLTIALKDEEMRDAFLEGLVKAGYSTKEVLIHGNIVGLVFDKPRTPQPVSRIKGTDWVTQRKNELLCKKYMEITSGYDTFPEKMKAIRTKAPELYDAVLNMGRSKPLFEAFEKIKGYLS